MSNLTTSTGGNLTLILDPNLCTLQTCNLSLASFSYIPNLAGNALYLAILAILFFVQLALGIRYRIWGFMGTMLLGLALEVIGYVGRVLVHVNPFDNNAFLIYLICVTIAPALLTAAIYLCLARIVTVYGAHFSRFRPRTYTLIFCSCDLLSLVLQGLGGGVAATANSTSGKNLGKNIMIAGLAFQVFSLLLFASCCGEFAWRLRTNKAARNPKFTSLVESRLFKYFLFGLGLATLTIFIRSVFRVAELSGGFNGKLFNEEVPFMILEGPMIIIACTAVSAFHPGFAFQSCWHEADFVFWTRFTLKNRKMPAAEEKPNPATSDEESGTHTGLAEVERTWTRK